MNKRLLVYLSVVLAVLALGAAPQPQRSVTYDRYDVDIGVQSDGSLLVTETYQLRFEGEFRTGFAEIPLDFVTDIVDIEVREGDEVYREFGSGPGTFTLERRFDAIGVEWEYAPTSGTEVRTFTVEYRVLGGLWVYPDRHILYWTAVPADRSGIPTQASRMTVRLPAPVDPADLTLDTEGVDAAVEIVDARTVVFDALGPIPDGTAFEVLVGFPDELGAAAVPGWQRRIDEQQTSYHWETFDVALSIESDGSLSLIEEQTITVDEGILYHGYRTIPWLYLDRITEIEVRGDDRPFEFSTSPCDYCYVVEEKPGSGEWVSLERSQVVIREDRVGSTLIEWAFPALVTGERATFQVAYTALGAVRVLSETQEINWTAVFADRDAPVHAASVELYLPPDLSSEDVTVSGGATDVQPDGSLRVTHDGPVPAGQSWFVRISMPADATTAAPPIWQDQLEAQLEREQARLEAEQAAAVRRARWQLALGGLGCLFPVFGLAGVITAWYIWGRDRAAPPVAAYLTAPPSDLPPGIVAYLVDEKPTVKGVLASLIHLATLGLITVDLQKKDFTVQLNWTREIEAGETVQVSGGDEVTLAEHKRSLFNVLVRRIREIAGDSAEDQELRTRAVPFSKIQRAFTKALPTIYEQMGEDASDYFSTLPETARRRWRWFGEMVIIAAGVVGLVSLCGTTSIGLVACVPPIGLALVGVMLMVVSRWMPQRTTLGIEEAARWQAFRRYLKNLQEFGDLESAQAVLDRYFSYAVALDVEEIVLRLAEEMEARVPIWMVPVPVRIGPTVAKGPAQPGLRDLVARELSMPKSSPETPQTAKVRPSLAQRPAGADVTLQGLSNSLSRSLNQASRSLGSLLNTAVGEVDASSSPLEVVVKGAGTATQMSWKAGTSTMKVLGDILDESSSGGGRGGFGGGRSRGGGFRSSSWGGSRSRSVSRPSGRSGGGGSRGFR